MIISRKEGIVQAKQCEYCLRLQDDNDVLCPSCELRFGLTLLRLGASIEPLHHWLDASVHMGSGNKAPRRTKLSTPPTPIRLAVLDLTEDITQLAWEIDRLLNGEQAHVQGVRTVLADIAADKDLARYHGMADYMRESVRIMKQVDRLLDPPSNQAIGYCTNPLCGVRVYADRGSDVVMCFTCGTEASVKEVQEETIKKLTSSDHEGTASQIARVFTNSGITFRRLISAENRSPLPLPTRHISTHPKRLSPIKQSKIVSAIHSLFASRRHVQF